MNLLLCKDKKEIKSIIIILVLLFLLIILRFYKSVDWFSFNFDEEYQASLAWAQVKDFHPIWIGVSASNFGFYLGPAFTYLNALLFWISKGDPSILAYFSSTFGIVTTFSLYFVTTKIFSKKVGLISAILYGFSGLIIYFDRRFWNPTPIAFITVWLLYSFYQAEKDTRWYILSTVLMATGLHIHLSLMVYWPLFLGLIVKNFHKIKPKTWLLSAVSYLIIVSPLIVFDLNHHFDNLLGPVRFILNPKTSGNVFGFHQILGHLFNLLDSTGRLIFMKLFTNIQEEHNLGAHGQVTLSIFLIKIFTTAVLTWFLIKARQIKHYRILTFMALSISAFYLFYPSGSAEYYLLSFFILFFIIMALFLSSVSEKATILLMSLFIIFNALTIFTTTQAQYGLTVRRQLINKVMLRIGNNPYLLDTVGKDPRKYHPYGGWRYLFSTYGNKPTKSSADEYFGWIYPEEISETKPLFKVTVSEQMFLECPPSTCVSENAGAFTAYIYQLN